MKKKITKATKTATTTTAKQAEKTTKAVIDKVAHAKELKRARDARYRAAKKAAKANKNAKAKPDKTDENVGSILQLTALKIRLAIVSTALIAIANDKEVPGFARDCAKSANKVLMKSVAIAFGKGVI